MTHETTQPQLELEPHSIAMQFGELAVNAAQNPDAENRIAEIRQLLDPENRLPKISPEKTQFNNYKFYTNLGNEKINVGYASIGYNTENGWNCMESVGVNDSVEPSPFVNRPRLWKKGFGTSIYLTAIEASIREGVDFGSTTERTPHSEQFWRKLVDLGIAEQTVDAGAIDKQNPTPVDTQYVVRAKSSD